MNTDKKENPQLPATATKKKQQWQVVYHYDCLGGISAGRLPTKVVHVHPEAFDHLSEAEDFMRNNSKLEESSEVVGDRPILLSAVQVRGPKRCSLQPRLETI
jgi:hypothetical protein